jgi:hypothetical protein
MKNSHFDKKFFHLFFLTFIILLLPLFILKEYRIIMAKKETQVLPAEDFFQAQLVENNNKRFTLIVLTKNNDDLIEENFYSILKQKYRHYQVVYIDERSEDQTRSHLSELIKKHEAHGKIRRLEVQSESEAFQAYFQEVHRLDDAEVVIHLSGNDVLAHEEVLNLIDQAYTNPDVWMTYGQYFDYYNYQKGVFKPKPQKVLCKKRVQRAPWLLASVKTFYAEHFKKIKKAEAADVYSVDNESSFFLPLAELGKAHVQFIPDVLYLHHPDMKMKKRKMKLSSKALECTEVIRHAAFTQEEVADIILFSQNTPKQVFACIESVQKKVKGIGAVSVIYECTEKTYTDYERLKLALPEVTFVRHCEDNLKAIFFKTLMQERAKASYVILSSDHTMMRKEVLLSSCIEAMRRTGAYGFYLHLGKEEASSDDEIFSWSVNRGRGAWREPNIFKMALYRKIDLERDFKGASFHTLSEWANLWAKEDSHYFGLSFESAKTFP